MRTGFLLASAVLLAGLATPSASSAEQEVETPTYEVLDARGPIERRRYAPMLVAEVTVAAENRDDASSKGFYPLANYIFGRNRPGEAVAMTAPVTTVETSAGRDLAGGDGAKIAMTAPVTTTPSDEASSAADTYTVRFMMPSEYTLDTLPAPVDPAVRLREVPARTLVTYRFTGARTAERVAQGEAAIADYVAEEGLVPAGPFATAGYDGPDVPTAERQWEMQQAVEMSER